MRISAIVRRRDSSGASGTSSVTGPTFVVDGRGGRRAVDWAFNAWGGLRGGLFFPWDNDDLLGHKIAELEGADCYQPGVVMEGGSFDTDGEGTLLVTQECLLNP